MIPRSGGIFHLLVCALVTAHMNDNILCEYCGVHTDNQLRHFITTCPQLQDERDVAWCKMTGFLAADVCQSLALMSEKDLFYIILGGDSEVTNHLNQEQNIQLKHVFAALATNAKPLLYNQACIFKAFRLGKVKVKK